MAIISIGIDLAKNVFAVHGINESGKPELLTSTLAMAARNAQLRAFDVR